MATISVAAQPENVGFMRETMSLEKQMGRTLLMNERRYIDRGKSHIIIAGIENDGDSMHFPQKGDIKKTLPKKTSGNFIISTGARSLFLAS